MADGYRLGEELKDGREVHLRRSSSIISQHIFNGKILVSAAFQLGLLCDLLPSNYRISRLRHVKCARPIEVNEESTPLHIRFESTAHKLLRFEICSVENLVHTTGKVELTDSISLSDETPISMLNPIVDNPNYFSEDIIDRFFRVRGANYGESYQGLTSIECNSDLSLGWIKLSDENYTKFRGYMIQPTLFDCALRSAIGILNVRKLCESEGEIYIPFSFGDIKMIRPITGPGIFRSAVSNVRVNAKFPSATMDVSLFAPDGTDVMQILGFTLAKICSGHEGLGFH